MKTIEIKTQAEFDALPGSFEEYTQINILCDIKEIIKNPNNSYYDVSGSAQVHYVLGSHRSTTCAARHRSTT